MLTVVNGDLVHSTNHTRHDDSQICGTEIVLRNSMAPISEIQLSAYYHGFFYSPVIGANSPPSAAMKNFNTTLVRVKPTTEPNLGENR